MNIALVGFDTEGKASYDYFAARGDKITICDQKASLAIPDGANAQLGLHYLDGLSQFDLIIRTPGLHPKKILEKNPKAARKITSGTDEFLAVCPTKNIIGITGTKGKGTTSSLIAKILEVDGKRVHLGGNIGVPALSLLPDIKSDDWVVLELSSFQLIDLKHSPHIGVCLMVVSEHMDWHADFQEYTKAKQNLFKQQTSEDIAIYYAENETSQAIASAGSSKKIPYYASPGAYVEGGFIKIDNQTICQVTELALLGEHNWQNVCAAITAVWHITQDKEVIRSVVTSFTGLPHRLELVREFEGVSYYDDSFGTTPETAIVAVQSFTEPKIIILGGSDKGASYDELAQVIASSSVRAVIVIGEIGPKIKLALGAVGYLSVIDGPKTMTEIVGKAWEYAEDGDVVLLSTASASFDMFENYKDRGDQFKQAVRALA